MIPTDRSAHIDGFGQLAEAEILSFTETLVNKMPTEEWYREPNTHGGHRNLDA